VMRRTALLGLALAAAACARGPKDQFPGAPVVLVSIDTLRADRLGAYGAREGDEEEARDGLEVVDDVRRHHREDVQVRRAPS
jgi:hypothetical protein